MEQTTNHKAAPSPGVFLGEESILYTTGKNIRCKSLSLIHILADAISIVKKNASAKFDETVELHIRTGCDGRHADQHDVRHILF